MVNLVTRLLVFSTFLAIALAASAQNLATHLNGFTLGQPRQVVHNHLGDPDDSGSNGKGLNYEVFVLASEPQFYIVFQYEEDEPERVFSIQVTGTKPNHDLGFRDLRMGMSATEVEKLLGKASKISDAGTHGKLWTFNNTNFSVEINPANQLASVRIYAKLDGKPNLENVPVLSELVTKLLKGTNAELANILAADVEIYENNKILSYGKQMQTEIATDASGVFAAVRRLAKVLEKVNLKAADEVDINVRMRYQKHPQHVIKLLKLPVIQELVFDWDGHSWRLWEIGTKPANSSGPTAWKNLYAPGTLKDITATHIPSLIKDPHVLLTGANGSPTLALTYNSRYTQSAVVMSGERRTISAEKRNSISTWLTTFGQPKELADSIQFEYKVNEAGVDYWLPVQKLIADRLNTEIKTGTKTTIYFIWLGIHYTGPTPEVLGLVNEFEKIP